MSQKHANAMHNKEAGFLGLEGMGSLLFYLIMLAGAAILIMQLFSTSKLARVEQAVSSMRIGIKHLYLSQVSYGNGTTQEERDMTKIIVDAGIAPKGFKYDADANAIISPWGTPIKVRTEDHGLAFSIVVQTPEEYCLRLATYDLNSWLEIKVGDWTITNEDTTSSIKYAYDVYKAHSSKDGLVNIRFFSE